MSSNNRIPKLLDDNARNYSTMLLGRSLDESSLGGVLDLRSKTRTLFTDLLVYLRFYSFLNSDAEVVLCCDKNNSYGLTEQRVTPEDRKYLHIVTLMETDGTRFRCYSRFLNKVLPMINRTLSTLPVSLGNYKKPLDLNRLQNQILSIAMATEESHFAFTLQLHGFTKSEITILTSSLPDSVSVRLM